MALWKFKCFLSETGRDLIDEWYRDLPPKAKAKLKVLLEHFRDTPQAEWSTNHFYPLTNYEGIYEIRFKINKVLYRPLGCNGPERNEFTFLIGSREQGDNFIPRKAPDTALERRGDLLKDKERANECRF